MAHNHRHDRNTIPHLLESPLYLSSGVLCSLARPAIPWLEHYYVVSMPRVAVASWEEDEFLTLVYRLARELAHRHLGDRECYSVLFNAGQTRRRPWPHAHLILATSVNSRRRSALLLQLKHLLWWKRWIPRMLGSSRDFLEFHKQI